MYENASQGHPNYLLLDFFFLVCSCCKKIPFSQVSPGCSFHQKIYLLELNTKTTRYVQLHYRNVWYLVIYFMIFHF